MNGARSFTGQRRTVHADMELRPLTRDDLRLYERVYTDPRMWLELGGVVEQDMAAKLERDVASVEADRHWVLVIVTEDATPAGTVALWDHEWEGETIDGRYRIDRIGVESIDMAWTDGRGHQIIRLSGS